MNFLQLGGNMKLLENINIVLEKKVIFGDIYVLDGKIAKIVEHGPQKVGFPILTPGFIDVHIHGSASFDAMDGEYHTNHQMALSLVKEGTTSYLPTTMTQSDELITKALKGFKEYYDNQDPNAAKVLGIHLEGPYLNQKFSGAQPTLHIRPFNLDEFKHWNKVSGNLIKKISIAPEFKENLNAIAYLKDNGVVVSAAHTNANYDDMNNAIKEGLTSLTHTFNAMTGLHHRDIGVVGAGLLHNTLSCELIFDKIHVSVPASKILLKNKTFKNVVLVTDSMRNKGMPDGISELGGQTVYIKNNEARLENGSLAGSILKMIDAYKNAINDLGVNLVKAAHMTSLNAARQLKVDDKLGSIQVGKFADLVLLDKNLNILKTYVNGKVVYEA
ncbi:MAG: N-acetylglucosamine-6-phosphate deacetylase [Candidatus Izemoplasmatales bacterium]|nr:N-acetylglucosamine-6-phosphate deacetylase [Candidatus Izemoplasmatales bacterium]